MGFIKGKLGAIFKADKIVDSVFKTVDDLVTTKEEKLQLKNELEKLIRDHTNDLEQQVTDRWSVDAGSESKLTKSIRPIFLLWVIVNFTLMAYADAIDKLEFTIAENYVDTFGQLLNVVVIAYFGSRGAEKIMKK